MAWVGAGIAAVSAVSQASAAGKAAKGQQRAADASIAEQQRQYDNNVALQAPTINAGNLARDNLLYRLGLSTGGTSNNTTVGGLGVPSSDVGSSTNPTEQTYDSLRSQLLGQYTRTNSNSPLPNGTLAPGQQFTGFYAGGSGTQYGGDGDATGVPGWYDGRNSDTSTVDEAGLEAAIQTRLAEQKAARDAAQQAAQAAAAADPNYGSLAREYVPETFKFDPNSLYDDPSYQFRLDQGQKAIDRQGAASGRFLSGGQLQASSNYNQAAASQEYGNVFNRAFQTFGVNEGNRANAWQANFNNAVNPLLSLAGAATLGSQNLGSAGMASANAIGQNLTNNANAQGAAGISTANNIANTANGVVQNYQSNQLLQGLLNNNSGVNNNPSGGILGYTPTFGSRSY